MSDPGRLLRIGISILIVGGITLAYHGLVLVNSTTVALTLLLAILGVATRWGRVEAIAASMAAMLSFNFFFLPPVGALAIADPQNWIALIAFLVTAVVGSQLSASAKRRALEATRRQKEMERLYEYSRSLMLLDRQSATAGQISRWIAQVFDLRGAAVFDRSTDTVYRTGTVDVPISDVHLRDLALQGKASCNQSSGLSALPLSLGGEPIGSVAIYGGSISDTALHAIANLAAIATERARAEATASRMEAAQQNEAMKSMLLDALAHEFKTPLTSIKAAASSILDVERRTQKELVTIIDEETDRLNSLVTDTIRMGRIEAGDLHLDREALTVPELVSRALETLRILLADREIRIELDDHLPNVMADAKLAGLTIRQLVINALKYSDPESAIAIQGRAENGCVRISVKDYGPGIPQRELSRVFEKYYRANEKGGRVPGTGMGLSIARDIVKAHGGDIWVESATGAGSEFFFTLPAVERNH